MDDLVAFLRARFEEDERTAQAVMWDGSGNTLSWSLSASATVEVGEYGFNTDDRTVANHIVSHDPARVLADIAAKRDVLLLFEAAHDYPPIFTSGLGARMEDSLRRFACAYPAHPDFRPEWALTASEGSSNG